MKKEQYSSLLALSYLSVVGVHILPLFWGSRLLWGVDFWIYYSLPAVIIFIISGLLPVTPHISNIIIRTTERIFSSRQFRSFSRRNILLYSTILPAAAVVFFAFRQETHFLGDGYLWVRNMMLPFKAGFKEPLGVLLYRGTYLAAQSTGLFSSVASTASAIFISMLSGVVFLIFAFKCSRTLFKSAAERTAVILALISTGTMALFFGYTEVYPPVAAGVMAFLYYGIRYLQGRAGPAAVLVLFAVNVFLHMSTIALLPGLIMLFLLRKETLTKRTHLYSIIFSGSAAGVVLIWYLQYSGAFSGFFSVYFLPVVSSLGTQRTAYSLLSWEQLADTLNELLLIVPVIVIAAAGLFQRGAPPHKSLRSVMLFLEVAAFFYVLEFIIFNKDLGVSRDWDIFSPMAFPLALLATMIVINRFKQYTPHFAALTFFIMILHTGSWTLINASEQKSIERFTDYIEHGNWSGFARSYAHDELRSYFESRKDHPSALPHALKAVEINPQSIRYRYNAAVQYENNGMQDEAIQLYLLIIHDDPDYIFAHNNLAGLYIEQGDYQRAETELQEVIRINPEDSDAYGNLLIALLNQNRTAEAIEAGKKAVELAPQNVICVNNLATAYRSTGELDEAILYFEQAVRMDQTNQYAYNSLGKIYFIKRDYAAAYEYFTQLSEINPSDLQVRFMIADCLRLLERYDESLSHLHYILQKEGENSDLLNSIAIVNMQINRLEDALPALERAVELKPDNGPAHRNLASVYFRLKNYSKSWEHVILAERYYAFPAEDFVKNLEKAMKRPVR
ncbi:tetratricopeptide repeat protein [candidate division KSB1 bacterium]